MIHPQKHVHKGVPYDTSAYRGCEQNNLIVHFWFTVLKDATWFFECFSRVRQNLIVIIDKHYLKSDFAFPNTIREILRHDQNCQNEVCKENALDKLKVVDVEYI